MMLEVSTEAENAHGRQRWRKEVWADYHHELHSWLVNRSGQSMTGPITE
jgi:hypothetical protein